MAKAQRNKRPLKQEATPSPPKRTRKASNLTLDPEALERGETFARAHGTSLSAVVSELLYALPSSDKPAQVREMSPAVQRLYGAARLGAQSEKSGNAEWREFLDRKYGGNGE